MRIVFLSTSVVPSRRADSVQVMKMSQAFARLDHEVTLVTKLVPTRQEPRVSDDHAFYGVDPIFPIVKVRRPAFKGGGLLFAAAVWRLLRRRRPAIDLVYSRSLEGALMAVRLGLLTVFEAHLPPRGRLQRYLLESSFSSACCRRLVVISESLRHWFETLSRLPLPPSVVVASDAADRVEPSPTPPRARDGNGWDANRFQVGYVGHLYPGKGFETFRALARDLPEFLFHVVGGEKRDLERIRKGPLPANLRLHGFVSPADLGGYYRRFDAAVMPYEGRVLGASRKSDLAPWMSPMKLFEYMAHGLAIVSSDLPVLREVLEHNRNALLVAPDDSEAWRRALRRLAEDPGLRRRLGEAARRDQMRHHTWEFRARRTLDAL